MKIKIIRNVEANTSSTKLITCGKMTDFNYPLFIKRLYAGESIEGIEYEPEDAFDQIERNAINKMLNDISDLCTKSDEPTNPSKESGDLDENLEE